MGYGMGMYGPYSPHFLFQTPFPRAPHNSHLSCCLKTITPYLVLQKTTRSLCAHQDTYSVSDIFALESEKGDNKSSWHSANWCSYSSAENIHCKSVEWLAVPTIQIPHISGVNNDRQRLSRSERFDGLTLWSKSMHVCTRLRSISYEIELRRTTPI